ncbi:hypothetical protein THOM_0930 [Trachipleistophora hominis]|uniref:Uncharacterized protein n=1 Tax=Trachipleistophora hominis TaxID=72359 RepID=L7JXP6_TRAHO|nr:hypothetical protein THOM_0930 [Trachipleistophora hominis]
MLKDYSVYKPSSHEYSNLLDYQHLENYVLGGVTTNDMKYFLETSMCTGRTNDYIDETLNTFRMANASLLSEIQNDWWSNGIDIWSANLPETFATDIDGGPSTSNNFDYSCEKTNCTILSHETNTTKRHVSGL